MLAVLKTGGKQYLVEEGRKLKIEKIDQKEGSEIIFKEILLIENNNEIKIGAPYVPSAEITATILKHGKDRKKIIFKFRKKTRYKLKKGYRQHYTEIEIKKIKI